MNYEDKMLKYKEKYLNLKKNIMKGGIRIDIQLLKDTNNPINSIISLIINYFEQQVNKYEIQIQSFGSQVLSSIIQFLLNSNSVSENKNTSIIRNLSKEIHKINIRISFCKEIIRKKDANEELNENEQMLYEYISIIYRFNIMNLDLSSLIEKKNYLLKEVETINYDLYNKINNQKTAYRIWFHYEMFSNISGNKMPKKDREMYPSKIRTPINLAECENKKAIIDLNIKHDQLKTDYSNLDIMSKMLFNNISSINKQINSFIEMFSTEFIYNFLTFSQEDKEFFQKIKCKNQEINIIFSKLVDEGTSVCKNIEEILKKNNATFKEIDPVLSLYRYCLENQPYKPFPGKPDDPLKYPFPDLMTKVNMKEYLDQRYHEYKIKYLPT